MSTATTTVTTCDFVYGCKRAASFGDRCRIHRDIPSPFEADQPVSVLTAGGAWIDKTATGIASSGDMFPVIWVEGVRGGPVPWPCDDVRPLDSGSTD